MQVTSEALIRLGFFFGFLAVLMLWEKRSPRLALKNDKKRRWLGNIGIAGLSTLLVRLFPVLPITAAFIVQQHGVGLFNVMNFRPWAAHIFGFLALDLTIYLQHVYFHHWKTGWRFHKMHHADLDIDATTGIRFHPGEIIISLFIKLTAIILLAVPPAAVIAFEIILNSASMFNHANIKLSSNLDRQLRKFIVTPDMHRVHHSIHMDETNSNYGFSLSWWDKLFHTYKAQPRDGHEKMKIGLNFYRNKKYSGLGWLMVMPFISEKRHP